MQVRESWQNVGHRIRTIRKQNKLTLRQLAKGCGLSTNAISLVERGQVAPTVETLCKIAGALGVRASSFLQEICPNEVSIIRAVDAESAGARIALGDWCSSVCGVEEQDLAASGYWQESVLCLNGEIEFEDSDGQTHRLSPGDRLICNGNALQRWRNPGVNPASMVMIVTPQVEYEAYNENEGS